MLIPAAWRAGPQPDLARLPASLDLRAISVAEGVRAALSVAILILLGEFLHLPGLAEASAGALLTCIGDAGGPIRRRTRALLAFALLGAAVTAGFGLLRPLGLPLVVPLATAAIFAFGFARVWGPSAMQVGNLLIVVTVLALDRTEPPRTALLLGAMFALGSVWALLLTMVIWRLHPYRPTRRAVATVFQRLGVMVADLTPMLEGAPDPAWEAQTRAHRRHVRDGLEAARALVLETLRIRGRGSTRANQSVIQVEAADQLFGVLIALTEVLEHADAPTRAAAAEALPALRLLLAALADATARDHATDDPAVHAMTTRLLQAFAGLQSSPALAGLAHACLSRLRVALLLTTPEGLLPGRQGTEPSAIPWRDQLLAPIRTNLRWSSATLRHAARAAVLAGPALAVTLSIGDAYAHWLTITLVLTLQPFFATAWQRALERSAGTVLGGILAAGLAVLVHGPVLTGVVLTPILILAFTVRAVSFGLFMACLTPVIVLLSELSQPGDSEFVIAGLRALYTVLGGLLAGAGNALLWPSWETPRLRTALSEALRTHAAYADVQLAALIAPAPPDAVETARRAAGVASNALETALNRALQEPGSETRAEARAGLVMDAALRRMAARLLALQHDPAQAGQDAALLRIWRTWLAAAFAAVIEGQPPPTPPPERDDPALGRIARQLDLIAGALAPPAASPP